MIIDSSAILAVIGKEPGYERIVHQLAASPETRIGAPTRLDPERETRRLIARLEALGHTVSLQPAA